MAEAQQVAQALAALTNVAQQSQQRMNQFQDILAAAQEQAQANRRAKAQMPVLETEDIEDFLVWRRTVESVLESNQRAWDLAERKRQIYQHVRGKAGATLGGLEIQAGWTTANLLDEIARRLQTGAAIDNARAKFKEAKQKSGEELHAYKTRLINLHTLAEPQMGMAERMAHYTLVDRFLEGLLDQDLYDIVAAQATPTIDEAYAACERGQKRLRARPKMKKGARALGGVSSINSISVVDSAGKQHVVQMTDGEEKRVIEAIANRRPPKRQYSQSGGGNGNDRSSIVCYNCFRQGHVRADCRCPADKLAATRKRFEKNRPSWWKDQLSGKKPRRDDKKQKQVNQVDAPSAGNSHSTPASDSDDEDLFGAQAGN